MTLRDERSQISKDWTHILNGLIRARDPHKAATDMARAIRVEAASEGKKRWANRPRRVEA